MPLSKYHQIAATLLAETPQLSGVAMAADGPVSQELKTLQEESSTSQKESAAAAAVAGAASMPESTEGQLGANDFVPASVILQQLHHDAPPGYFTLDWLMSKLQKQSFGLFRRID